MNIKSITVQNQQSQIGNVVELVHQGIQTLTVSF